VNRAQRTAIASATYLVAIVLFVFFFAHPVWSWATWDRSKGTLDLGFVKVTNRPPFPSDAKGIGVGLILPIVLVAVGRVVSSARE
jgi:hypothetical protein